MIFFLGDPKGFVKLWEETFNWRDSDTLFYSPYKLAGPSHFWIVHFGSAHEITTFQECIL